MGVECRASSLRREMFVRMGEGTLVFISLLWTIAAGKFHHYDSSIPNWQTRLQFTVFLIVHSWRRLTYFKLLELPICVLIDNCIFLSYFESFIDVHGLSRFSIR